MHSSLVFQCFLFSCRLFISCRNECSMLICNLRIAASMWGGWTINDVFCLRIHATFCRESDVTVRVLLRRCGAVCWLQQQGKLERNREGESASLSWSYTYNDSLNVTACSSLILMARRGSRSVEVCFHDTVEPRRKTAYGTKWSFCLPAEFSCFAAWWWWWGCNYSAVYGTTRTNLP